MRLLQDALKELGGNLTEGEGPLKGSVSLPLASSQGSAATLSLKGLAARLWAIEMALLHYAAGTAIERYKRSTCTVTFCCSCCATCVPLLGPTRQGACSACVAVCKVVG